MSRFLRVLGVGAAALPSSLYVYEKCLADDCTLQRVLPHLRFESSRIDDHFSKRPFTVAKRLAAIAFEVAPFVLPSSFSRLFRDSSASPDESYYPALLSRILESLGPLTTKFGQNLSIRPDLVPSHYLPALSKLCDSCTPFDDEVGRRIIADEIFKQTKNSTITTGSPETTAPPLPAHQQCQHQNLLLDSIFDPTFEIKRVASASIGQVYKARLRSPSGSPSPGRLVAIKVKRPGIDESVLLDLYLGRKLTAAFSNFTATFTKQLPDDDTGTSGEAPNAGYLSFFDTFALGTVDELNYDAEARNQLFFKADLERRPVGRHCYVPDVFSVTDCLAVARGEARPVPRDDKACGVLLPPSPPQILISEWLDGTKLSDCPSSVVKRLIPIGVDLFIVMLLEIGKFHCDPHPGNLIVLGEGENARLGLLDFGLVATVSEAERYALTSAVVHLLQGDLDTLITQDSKKLGFLAEDYDTAGIEPLIKRILTTGLIESGSDLVARRRKFADISGDLNDVFFNFPFHTPAFFALITRGLGLLEGIAVKADPTFNLFVVSTPFALRYAWKVATIANNNNRQQQQKGSPPLPAKAQL